MTRNGSRCSMWLLEGIRRNMHLVSAQNLDLTMMLNGVHYRHNMFDIASLIAAMCKLRLLRQLAVQNLVNAL